MRGRPPLYGLAAAGAPGVARAIDILADEFDSTLPLTGCRYVAALSRDLIDTPRR
jgi:isopentenyl diphosphate isomerase/L-lactate dehydrogenase-like FMN-dependent dehydrogenase